MNRTILLSTLAVLAMCATVPAQVFDVIPDVVTPWESISMSICDPANAGKPVEVVIFDPTFGGPRITITIDLDGEGCGNASWIANLTGWGSNIVWFRYVDGTGVAHAGWLPIEQHEAA